MKSKYPARARDLILHPQRLRTRETKKMPILEDIMNHDVLGPAIRQGRAEGQIELLLGMIEKKFGGIPPRIHKRIASLKPNQIKTAGLRLLEAQRIEDLFAG
jgi:hypothetical protein